MNEQSVQELLAAWRAAQRRLEDTTDAAAVEALVEETQRLRDAYQRAVRAVEDEEVAPHEWRP